MIRTYYLLILFISGHSLAETVSLSVGRQMVLNKKGIKQISIGDSKVIDVKISPDHNQLVIFGLQAGISDLTVWTKTKKPKYYTVNVIGQDLSELEDYILSTMPYLSIKATKRKLVIKGQIRSLSHYQQVQDLLTHPQLTWQVTFAPSAKEQVAKQLDTFNEVFESGLQKIVFHQLNITTTTPVAITSDQKQWLLQRLPTLNIITQSPHQLLAVEAKFVEVNQNSLQEMGFDAQHLVQNIAEQIYLFDDYQRSLAWQLSEGKATILSRPVIYVGNGEQASIHIGGEFPIEIQKPDYYKVDWKKFGIELDITVSELQYRNYQIAMVGKVSRIDFENSQSEIPVFIQRTFKTKLVMPADKTLVISGLINNLNAIRDKKLPFLSDIPLLGALFTQQREHRENSDIQLAITISPRVKNHP